MAESLFEVTTERRDGVGVVGLHGEIDVVASRPSREAITAELSERPSALVIDLSKVTFFGSAGLQTLLLAVEQGQVLGVPVVLAAPSDPVRRVLDLTGLTGEFVLHPTLDDALGQQRAR